MSSLSCRPPLHEANDVTPLPMDLNPIATYEISCVHFPPPSAFYHHFVYRL